MFLYKLLNYSKRSLILVYHALFNTSVNTTATITSFLIKCTNFGHGSMSTVSTVSPVSTVSIESTVPITTVSTVEPLFEWIPRVMEEKLLLELRLGCAIVHLQGKQGMGKSETLRRVSTQLQQQGVTHQLYTCTLNDWRRRNSDFIIKWLQCSHNILAVEGIDTSTRETKELLQIVIDKLRQGFQIDGIPFGSIVLTGTSTYLSSRTMYHYDKPLYGRATRSFWVHPLKPNELAHLFKRQGINDNRTVLWIYAVTGGRPQALKLLFKKGLLCNTKSITKLITMARIIYEHFHLENFENHDVERLISLLCFLDQNGQQPKQEQCRLYLLESKQFSTFHSDLQFARDHDFLQVNKMSSMSSYAIDDPYIRLTMTNVFPRVLVKGETDEFEQRNWKQLVVEILRERSERNFTVLLTELTEFTEFTDIKRNKSWSVVDSTACDVDLMIFFEKTIIFIYAKMKYDAMLFKKFSCSVKKFVAYNHSKYRGWNIKYALITCHEIQLNVRKQLERQSIYIFALKEILNI